MAKNFDEELTGGRRVRGKDDIAIRAVIADSKWLSVNSN